MHKMQEFLLWSNCTNQCAFCWQCKKKDQSTYLNEEEMVKCINTVEEELDKINVNDDVLLVGGEILASYYFSVDIALQKLIDKCVRLLEKNIIRYLYINTNLLYENRINLTYLLNRINGLEDRLKFTTSFDIYGRFNNKKSKALFLNNLKYVTTTFPDVNIVVNSIITKQLVESTFDFDKFKKEYRIKYINFIPYIPVENDRSMDVSFFDIAKVLIKNEKKQSGFIDFYINDLDYNQDKILYEYHKNKGFKECTAKYLPCHHNENFKKVTGDECYICKLKDVFK